MLIGVDAGCLGVRDERLKVGVYQMAKNLLLELGKIDQQNSYLLYSFYPIEKKLLLKFGRRMHNIIVKPSRGWLKIWLPLQMAKDKPDIFLALSQAVPLKLPFSPRPYTIGFIYDVAFEKFPAMYSSSLIKLQKNTREVVKNSNFILTISNSTKEDIVSLYGISAKKIKPLYPGVSKIFNSKGVKCQSKKQYFLFVGALKKIKNVPNIVKGFSYFLRKTKKDYDLILIGGDKWLDENIQKTVVGLKAERCIKTLGYVDEDKLARLYRSAVAFVSPSFYEGFGLTFLEAMASGCPVIGSKSGSIPEVVRNCGILVNPKSPKEIGKAMIILTQNQKARNKYIKRGIIRSKQFSWHTFAEKVLSCYEQKT